MIPQEAESIFVRRRQRQETLRIAQMPWLVVVLTGLLLLIGSQHCNASEEVDRHRDLQTDLTVPLPEPGALTNSTLAATTLDPTPLTTTEPTLSPTDPTPVELTVAPLDQGKITAYFQLYFQIEDGPLAEGYMNDTQILYFDWLMETMHDNYLPLEIREVTPVFCDFEDQLYLDFALSRFVPFPPEFTSLAPSQTPKAGPDAETPQTAAGPANRNLRWLEALGLSKLTNAISEQPTGADGLSRQSRHQARSAVMSNPANGTLSTRRMQQLPPGFVVNDTHYYVYYFQMEFSSASEIGLVNLTKRPFELENYVNENGGDVAKDLAQILGVDPLERLAIITMDETPRISDAPSAAPTHAPSASFVPSSAPTASSAPSTSSKPSQMPSLPPTWAPSLSPSAAPSSLPTFDNNSTVFENYDVTVMLQHPLSTAGYMNESQEAEFCFNMENQTAVFAHEAVGRVVTNCTFFGEVLIVAQEPITLAPRLGATQEANTTIPATAPGTRRRRASFLRRSPPTRSSTGNITHTRARTRLYYNGTNTTQSYLLWPVAQPPRTKQTKRRIQEEEFLSGFPNHTYTYSFRMRYTSESENLENYTNYFFLSLLEGASWFNPMLTDILNLNASNNLQIQSAQTFQTKSSAPTQSLDPSESPTLYPTELPPTTAPTFKPTDTPPPTASPTSALSPVASASATSVAPPENNDSGGVDGTTLVVVVVVVALGSLASLAGLAWFYKSRQSKMHQLIIENMNANEEQLGRDGGSGGQSKNQNTGTSGAARSRYDDTVATVSLSPCGEGALGAPLQMDTGRNGHLVMAPSTSESILSNPSLLSNGQGEDEVDVDLVGHDVDEFHTGDSMLSPLDDFDRFKDQNLEKMRSHVEDNVTGMDGMMSQALTHALMPGGDNASLLWSGAQEAMEIEANALWEVTDWMKKSEFASVDEKLVTVLIDIVPLHGLSSRSRFLVHSSGKTILYARHAEQDGHQCPARNIRAG
jgi:hypothetical protein